MGFDDWSIRTEIEWNDDWNEDPEQDYRYDWVDKQQEVELAFDILVHTSNGAYLLQFDEKNVWVPKSMATINMSMHKNTVLLPKWLMIEKELEEYRTSTPKETAKVNAIFNKVIRKNIKELEDDVPF